MTGGEQAFLALVIFGMLFFGLNLAAAAKYAGSGKQPDKKKG